MTYLCDEIFGVVRHEARKAQIDGGDAAICLRVTLSLERWLANEELVAEHTEAPQVDLLVVHLTLDHLRGQVIEGATKCATSANKYTSH